MMQYLKKNQGKSDRAYRAESEGLLPLSKIVKDARISRSIRQFAKPDEWHHTGKFGNRTEFWLAARIQYFLKFKKQLIELENLHFFAESLIMNRNFEPVRDTFETCRTRIDLLVKRFKKLDFLKEFDEEEINI